jgi:hypothetical protein
MLSTLLHNTWLVAALSGLGGAMVTIATALIIGKRGLLTYNVWHDRIAVAANDPIFGSVQVLWNGATVNNLYSSIVELRNESLKDYDNVIVKVFTTTTSILSERTEIVGTTHILQWTPAYAALVHVPAGQVATQSVLEEYWGGREYVIPTMNRGQVVRINLLNVAKAAETPSIWVDVLHKGVRLQFRVMPQQILGVPQPAAVLVGTLFGLPLLALAASLLASPWAVGAVGLVYGILVVVPGVAIIKSWRWIRSVLGG